MACSCYAVCTRGRSSRCPKVEFFCYPGVTPYIPWVRGNEALYAKCMIFLRNLERANGFEPSTLTLARLCSTPELRPQSKFEGGGYRPSPGPVSSRSGGHDGLTLHQAVEQRPDRVLPRPKLLFQSGEIGRPAGARPAAPSSPPRPGPASRFRPARCAGSGSAPAPARPASISSRRIVRRSEIPPPPSSSAPRWCWCPECAGWAGAWISCNAWAMNSMSISPPGAYFRSQRLRPGYCGGDLFAHLPRIGQNMRAHRAAR